jgi:hypothetical protein
MINCTELKCDAMTLIAALLLLPEHGEPESVDREVARALNGSSAWIARRHGTRWSLSDAGRRFLAQFRPGGSSIVTQVVVRLVIEDGVPVFHILGDENTLLKVDKAGLRRSLQDLQSVNPDMKVVFDFRSSGRMS